LNGAKGSWYGRRAGQGSKDRKKGGGSKDIEKCGEKNVGKRSSYWRIGGLLGGKKRQKAKVNISTQKTETYTWEQGHVNSKLQTRGDEAEILSIIF